VPALAGGGTGGGGGGGGAGVVIGVVVGLLAAAGLGAGLLQRKKKRNASLLKAGEVTMQQLEDKGAVATGQI